ncbi:hypothetical protein [Chitinimonas sp. JJ19]|uniref:hypothetical protein n=1 Tax=Chitinimonas sp. JJ19 TaxID=3109352 RepID=UPI0030035E8C
MPIRSIKRLFSVGLPRMAVVSPTGLDTYRDGGSLSVSFLGGSGTERTLLFPVHLAIDGAKKFARAGYLPQQMEGNVRTPRISPITGLESMDTARMTEEVTWEEARRIRCELAPLMPQSSGKTRFISLVL